MDEPRPSEVVELYKFLGYEVKFDPSFSIKQTKNVEMLPILIS